MISVFIVMNFGCQAIKEMKPFLKEKIPLPLGIQMVFGDGSI